MKRLVIFVLALAFLGLNSTDVAAQKKGKEKDEEAEMEVEAAEEPKFEPMEDEDGFAWGHNLNIRNHHRTSSHGSSSGSAFAGPCSSSRISRTLPRPTTRTSSACSTRALGPTRACGRSSCASGVLT